MDTRHAAAVDLGVVASWIGSARECELWAGPRLRYPLRVDSLAEQLEMSGAFNLALDDERGLVAFGQALLRSPGRVHLARLIVRPNARGRGVGRVLCEALLGRAASAGLVRATLNVYRDNAVALHLYQSLGFRPAARPDDEPRRATDVVFMERRLEQGGGPDTHG